MDVMPEYAMHDNALQEAYKSADQFGWSKEDLEAYDYRGIKMQDARGALQFAEEKGVQRNRIETAHKMLIDRLEPVMIAKYTGLSPDEVNKLVR
ncbi:MAG: hypothetical protein B6242_11690 [Anaerolineaceae bacterium 4572_78]|nr:MAG: hypothetical protein B6242_11690 [Anaerolineaceae bacterium 4572_78]